MWHYFLRKLPVGILKNWGKKQDVHIYIIFIYLFLDRGEGKKKEKEGNRMCGCLLCTSNWRPGPQPRHVPWSVIEPVILWFTGWHSIHWATPARAEQDIFWHLLPCLPFSILFFFLKHSSFHVVSLYVNLTHFF